MSVASVSCYDAFCDYLLSSGGQNTPAQAGGNTPSSTDSGSNGAGASSDLTSLLARLDDSATPRASCWA